jgi:murein L,D-transpeptidase YcbB/YkuD
MRRRLFLLASVAATLSAADTRQELIDLFGSMASALTENTPDVFLRAIDRSMPGYAQFAANVTALAAQNDLSSTIEINKQEGDESAQVVELDWILEIRGRGQSHIFERRQTVVKGRLERVKKKWRVVSLEPAAFFAPPLK